MAKLFFMCGLPFAGKSTVSQALALHLQIPRISWDETWVQTDTAAAWPPGVDCGAHVDALCESQLAACLQHKVSVVYDNLHARPENRQRVRQLAADNGAEAVLIYVEATSEEVIARRVRNLLRRQRAQVSDPNFYGALAYFVAPAECEQPVVFRRGDRLEVWLIQQAAWWG